jgi:ketosteroid isomerase-like protein
MIPWIVVAAPAHEIVQAWHAALNAGDIERLLALSSSDIEVGGPRGSGRGGQLLRDWFGRAGIHLEPLRTYSRGDRVVVEQRATWAAADPGTASAPQGVASVFVVTDGRVSSVMRYADLAAALAASGLTPDDHV